MRNVESKREFNCVWIENKQLQNINVNLKSIYEKEENEVDLEYNYAIQDSIDAVLDLKVGEHLEMRFCRDDFKTLGLIHRIK